MQRFVSLMRLTDRGLATMADSPTRRRLSEGRVSALGGRSTAFYATLGSYDFVQVFEMPDAGAMARYALSARRDGHVDPLILPAFDVEAWGGILSGALSDQKSEDEP